MISLLDWEKEGDDDAVIEPVVDALSKGSEQDIRMFEEVMSACLFALDTEAHAREIGEYRYKGPDVHFSMDTFLYVRCCVVANGADHFASVVRNPKEMPEDKDFESLLSIASNAFERKTGGEFDYSTKLSYETFSNKDGWA